MTSFDLNSINSALNEPKNAGSGVDFSGKSLKLNTEQDAKPIVDAINQCSELVSLTLTGNTLGVEAAQAIARALERRPELKICRWSDMFTGRMKTEIPPALSALGDGMIAAGARLAVLDLSDNAFGPIGVQGLAKLLQSDVCQQLQELHLNNNGLGVSGARLLAGALGGARALRVFVAGRNRLENDGATALAAVFQNMGTLEEVSMPQNGIYHAGVSALAAAFTHNPRLARLNLNDNTAGARGAAALAAALPSLKNLRSINVGDCLLKSKGVRALAKGLRESSLQLESLDVSHNEVCRAAVGELLDALGAAPPARLVLAGNSLGGAAARAALRSRLGDAAQLSDGDGSDDEYVTESEDSAEEEEDEASSAGSEDSAPEDEHTVLHTHTHSADHALDTSGVEEVESAVALFLSAPSAERLAALGPGVVDVIDTHLQAIKDPTDLIQAYVDAAMCVSGLADDAPSADGAGLELLELAVRRAGQQHAAAWQLADTMLRALGLIKSESKQSPRRWRLPAVYAVLARAVPQPWFPPALRDTLRFFIASKRAQLPDDTRTVIDQHPTLYK